MKYPDIRGRRYGTGLSIFSVLFGAVLLLLSATDVLAAPEPGFKADESLADNARKWAREFVAFAAERYDVELDFSQVSMKYLDDIVNELHGTFTAEQPDEALVTPIARALGSYIAEVYRIFHGGEWGWIELESGTFPGVRAESGAFFFPMKKALDRITTGEDPDLWEYFQILSTR